MEEINTQIYLNIGHILAITKKLVLVDTTKLIQLSFGEKNQTTVEKINGTHRTSTNFSIMTMVSERISVT